MCAPILTKRYYHLYTIKRPPSIYNTKSGTRRHNYKTLSSLVLLFSLFPTNIDCMEQPSGKWNWNNLKTDAEPSIYTRKRAHIHTYTGCQREHNAGYDSLKTNGEIDFFCTMRSILHCRLSRLHNWHVDGASF